MRILHRKISECENTAIGVNHPAIILFFRLIFVSAVFFLSTPVFSQGMSETTNIDSMLTLLKKSKEDTNKVNLLGEITHYYSTKELEKAVEYAEQALFLAKQVKFRRGEGSALLQVGNINNDLGKVESAVSNFEQVIEIADELNDKRLKMSAYNNLGISFFNRAEYNKALEYYLKYTRLAEDLNDLKFLSRAYNNAANIYIRLEDYKKALEYHFKGLEISEKLNDKVLIAGSYNNIGIVYKGMGEKEKALEYYFKTLKMAEELQHKLGMTYALNNIGTMYSQSNQPEKALPYIDRALKIKREIGEQKGIANTLNNAGACYLVLNRSDEALKSYLESSAIAREIEEKGTLMLAYEGLRNVHELKGDFKKAFDYALLHSAVKDSIYNREKSEQVTEMQTRYETEKKEKELKLQSIEIEKKDAQVQQQKTQRNALMAGLALVLALAIAVFIAFRQKQKTNSVLSLQNEKIKRQNRIIEKAHSILEGKSKDITESIMYAQRIQQAILPMEEEIEKIFPESFIFYKPRDIVSGDFYWFSRVDNFYVLAVADCTGHGVPGAFMSMIGNDMLNQVVYDAGISNPAKALELMDKKISKALTKSKAYPNNKDGMDMAMAVISEKRDFLRYSGANRPLYIVRNGGMLEFKPASRTLGIIAGNNELFQLHDIPLQKGDAIYLFTDGFADQFGGEKNKKFMIKRFKEMLISISAHRMPEQKQIIEKRLDEWKGKQKQVDDICVIGLRV